jgi:hypothetical protein
VAERRTGEVKTDKLHASYHYDGRAWVVDFDDGALSTWGRTLASARRHAREALAVALDFDSVEDLEERYVVVDHLVDLPEEITSLAGERAQIEHERTWLEARTVDAAKQLVTKWELSTRDAAMVLGISHARVHQLTSSPSDSVDAEL